MVHPAGIFTDPHVPPLLPTACKRNAEWTAPSIPPSPRPPTRADESTSSPGTYARLVQRRVIDGERWIAERLAFLRERLAGELAAEERRAIEAEMEVLSKERGISIGGLRAGRIGRRLRRNA